MAFFSPHGLRRALDVVVFSLDVIDREALGDRVHVGRLGHRGGVRLTGFGAGLETLAPPLLAGVLNGMTEMWRYR